ncbi:YceI family protein [Marinoscillum sp. MHG1-6]|uniref:YceI family protein n=1 Tax=Marinoscillum sp. MHG1-6 TaxID=2959627 RepID=UPI002157EF3D|nr:YceI family protein [Marinoscillum sp. MHG1-6]
MLQTILLSISLLLSSGDGTDATYSVDTEESSIAWVGKKVTGQHNGSIEVQSGTLKLEEGKLVGGSFTVDMTSLVSEDLEGEWKSKLEGHLKSDDFFGVEKYPTSNFVIKKAKALGAGKYNVTGEITIKGITQPIDFPVQLVVADDKVTGTANIVIDRSKFNVKYGSGSFFDDLGDKTIYDDFELSVSIVAAK